MADDNKLQFRIKTKKLEGRRVTALASKLNVVDDWGVELAEGSVDGQRVVISDWNHSAADPFGASRPPIGRGTLYERGDDVVLKGEFFDEAPPYLVTEDGEIDDNIEWSIVWNSTEYSYQKRDNKTVKVVTKTRSLEASPVLAGAVGGTKTENVRTQGENQPPEESASDDNLQLEALYHTHRGRSYIGHSA